jgi:hypothetical protein
MSPKRSEKNDLAKAMRAAALSLPETEEGIACEGTALEKCTVKVRDKAFLFVGAKDAMVKLSDSLKEASDLANKLGCCKVGAHGWVTVTFEDAGPLPDELARRWVLESYRLAAPKKLLATLPAAEQPNVAASKSTRKKKARYRAQ